MKWDYWFSLYLQTHCVARGLSAKTIAAYEATLKQYRAWAEQQRPERSPDQLLARDVLSYVEHLRRDRHNGGSAVNRSVVVIRGFYRAVVAMGHMAPRDNPLAQFPKIKATARKLPVFLSPEEAKRLMDAPGCATIIDLRDRAILAMLYATGIRASECAQLRADQLDWSAMTVTVIGKGGHERTVPLNPTALKVLQRYSLARGPIAKTAAFFRSRRGRSLSRCALYERVRTWGRRCRLSRKISPHKLRHTFATHLLRAGVGLVTIRDLLGHRLITSTQIYLHVTAEDLRAAVDRHPIARLIDTVKDLLPDIRLPFQHRRPAHRFV